MPGSRPQRRRSPGRPSRRRRLPLGLRRLGDAPRLLGGPARIFHRTPRRLGKTNRLDPYPPGWPGEVERTRATREGPTLVSGAVAQLRTRHRPQGKRRGKRVSGPSSRVRAFVPACLGARWIAASLLRLRPGRSRLPATRATRRPEVRGRLCRDQCLTASRSRKMTSTRLPSIVSVAPPSIGRPPTLGSATSPSNASLRSSPASNVPP